MPTGMPSPPSPRRAAGITPAPGDIHSLLAERRQIATSGASRMCRAPPRPGRRPGVGSAPKRRSSQRLPIRHHLADARMAAEHLRRRPLNRRRGGGIVMAAIETETSMQAARPFASSYPDGDSPNPAARLGNRTSGCPASTRKRSDQSRPAARHAAGPAAGVGG